MSRKSSMPDGERYSYDYFFLDHVCRLCWGADATIELTSFNPKSIENDATIAEKIQECVGIDVTAHSHPKKVCSKCLTEIEIFIEFKRFCLESDRKLNDILIKGSPHPQKRQYRPATDNEDKLYEISILKEDTDVEFSNYDLDDSIDDVLDDLPLSCEIRGNIDDMPANKETKKKSLTYCNFCHIDLDSKIKLAEHNLECHGIENGLYKCFGCERGFKSMKKRHRHETEICKELECGYKCNICLRYLPKRRLYEHHMRAHREKKEIDLSDDIYKCKKCLKPFESTEHLKEHMLTECQTDKKNYVCDICGRVFSRRDYLYKHKLIHEGNKKQKCPHCDYRAVQKSSLTVHIRTHTGERPYPCDLCPHRCVTRSNLVEHRKRHFGIKRFECKLCDKKFGYKISLEEHMSAVHDRSESPHVCAQCGSSYSRFRGLRRHLLVKHGKKVKKLKDGLLEVPNVSTEETKDVECDMNEDDAMVQNADGDVFME